MSNPQSSNSAFLLATAVFLTAAPFGVSAAAHEAKSGWTYPLECCSDRDCREVPAANITERPDGYVISMTGERVGYTDPRVRNSPDGVYHWCSPDGASDSRTICLFVPPQSF